MTLRARCQPYLVIIAAGFALYARTLSFGFSFLDDNALILQNFPFIRDFNNFFTAFAQDVFHVMHGPANYFRPLLTVSLMWDAQFSGLSAWGYHLTNIIIHLATVCLLYKLLKTLQYRDQSALLVALLFLVHPVLTQAVAWIPGRNDSLLALFALLAFWLFGKWLNSPQWSTAVAYFIALMLALWTKETAMLLPFFFVLYQALFATLKPWTKKSLLFLALHLPLLVLYWQMRSQALAGTSTPLGFMLQSLWQNLPAIIPFVGKILFPFNLSVLPIMRDMTFTYGYIALAMIAAVLIVTRGKNWKKVGFGLLWFVAMLVPSFIRPNPDVPADFIEHRIYLPLVGIVFILLELPWIKNLQWYKPASSNTAAQSSHPERRDLSTEASAKGLESLLLRSSQTMDNPQHNNPSSKISLTRRATSASSSPQLTLPAWVALTVLGVFFATTLVYSSNFQDRIAFWQNAVQNSPDYPLAQRNLGAMLYLDGQIDAAKPYYQKALALNPLEPMAHNNLGLIAAHQGNAAEAEQQYKDELVINPNYDAAHFNLGLLYYNLKQYDKAKTEWEATLRINPDYQDAKTGLAALPR